MSSFEPKFPAGFWGSKQREDDGGLQIRRPRCGGRLRYCNFNESCRTRNLGQKCSIIGKKETRLFFLIIKRKGGGQNSLIKSPLILLWNLGTSYFRAGIFLSYSPEHFSPVTLERRRRDEVA